MEATIVAAFSLMVVIGLPSLAKGYPTISRCPISTTVQVGDTITWTCVEDPLWGKPYSFAWYKLGIYAVYEVRKGAKFSKRVTKSDSGRYKCSARYTSYSDEDSDWLTLTVNERDDHKEPDDPTMIWYPAGPVNVGDTITMVCLADPEGGKLGKLDSYNWYSKHEGDGTYSLVSLKTTAGQDYIFSKKVKQDDSGTYFCQASYYYSIYFRSHCYSKNSTGRKLEINDPPNTPTITGWPDKSTFDVGKSLSLTCNATTAGGSSISYIWYKDSAVLSKQKNAKYSIKNVKSADGGEYVCQAKSNGISRNSTVRTLFVKDSETWTMNCSTMWTGWMSPYPDSHIEYSNQFCVEISSQGRNRNWTFEQKNRSRRASEFDGAFRATMKTFTEALLNNSSTEFKALRHEFMSLLEKVYKGSENKDVGNPVKEVLITGFKEGSVIVHYRVVLTNSVKITDYLANISKTLADYLENNPADREKYGIAPSSKIDPGGIMPIPQAENSRNQFDVNILAVALTIIVLLVVAVVVLVVFLVRMKRSHLEKEPGGKTVAFRAESNGSGAAVNVQDRKTSGARSNFDPYSGRGERNVDADDDYMSLSEEKMIARPKVVNDNAVYETEEADYLDIVGERMVVSASLQAKLEDGYRRHEADAPVYRVQHVKPEPLNATSAIGNEDAVYSFAEDTGASSKVTGGQGVESVYALAEDNGDVYAIPVKKQFRDAIVPVYSLAGNTIPEQAPRKNTSCDNEVEDDAVYSLAEIPGGIPKPSQFSLAENVNVDNEDYYSQTYGRAPGAKQPDKNNMAANGWQGKGLPSDGDGDEYSRLQLPTLSKPTTMQYLEKKPKQMKGVNSGREDVPDDDEEDYAYGTACEVIL